MDIVPIIDVGLGNSSYVVDLGDGSALVVDPERDPSPYLEVAERRKLRLRFTVETHLHADFVSGSRELIAEGAELLAPGGSDLAFDYRRLEDGEEIEVGGMTLRAIATPGHTPEHLAYLLLDDASPLALFSGGTLITGGVARTDLLSPDLTEPLARAAYRSIRDRLLVLPDDLAVYPTHGAGSFCSTASTGERTTTIGRERRSNPLLNVDTEDDFVATLLGGFGSYPLYFGRLRDLNRAGPEVYGANPPVLRPLSQEEVATLQADGAVVVDARPIERYAAGHIPNSVSIELRDQFGTWLGWLADPNRPIIIVVDDDQDITGLVWQILNVGFEPPKGRLAGGISAWRAAGRPITQTDLIPAAEVSADRTIVDVRQFSEWQTDHVTGAVHIELGDIAAQAAQLEGDIQLHCGHGQRAMTAASLLEQAGVEASAVVTGGPRQVTAALAGSQP
ncbi:MAG: MBL fold metallo-hydrolase [Acidobacteria bacterium]|nr:MBL fold metallo-hydrolase [Acidobacteriota bacterium]